MTHRTHLLQGGVISIDERLLDQALGQVQHLREVVTGVSQLVIGHPQHCCVANDAV